MAVYRVLADLIVVIHAAYVGFVVFGQVVILVGLCLRQSWARDFTFRVTHLVMIGIVVFESLIGLTCPLTTWEQALRKKAGSVSYTGDFLGYWAHRLIFFQAEPWVFTLIYSLFGALVVATFVIAPPRRRRRQELRAQ